MKKGEKVSYEWVVRLYDDEFEDFIDVDCHDTYAEAVEGLNRALSKRGTDVKGCASIELHREIEGEDDDFVGFQYCWANGDTMNTDFNEGAKVPNRYLQEFIGFTGKRPDVDWYVDWYEC